MNAIPFRSRAGGSDAQRYRAAVVAALVHSARCLVLNLRGSITVGPLPLLIVGLLGGLAACEDTSKLDLDRIRGYTPAPYASMLDTLAVGGRLDYSRLEGYPREALDTYIRLLAEAGPIHQPRQFPREPQRAAFYLNAHNALVARTWAEHGAAEAVARGETPEFDPAWLDEAVWVVDGKTVSINDLRRAVLRQNMPLAPLALVDGTVRSPPVPPVIDPNRIEQQLQQQAMTTLRAAWTFELLDGGDAPFAVRAEDVAGTDDASAEPSPAPLALAIPALLEAAEATDTHTLYDLLNQFLSGSDARNLALLSAAREGRMAPMPPDPRINQL